MDLNEKIDILEKQLKTLAKMTEYLCEECENVKTEKCRNCSNIICEKCCHIVNNNHTGRKSYFCYEWCYKNFCKMWNME